MDHHLDRRRRRNQRHRRRRVRPRQLLAGAMIMGRLQLGDVFAAARADDVAWRDPVDPRLFAGASSPLPGSRSTSSSAPTVRPTTKHRVIPLLTAAGFRRARRSSISFALRRAGCGIPAACRSRQIASSMLALRASSQAPALRETFFTACGIPADERLGNHRTGNGASSASAGSSPTLERRVINISRRPTEVCCEHRRHALAPVGPAIQLSA